MFENAVALDPKFALAYAAIVNTCAQYHNLFEREAKWVDRATAASKRASKGRRGGSRRRGVGALHEGAV
jgi:hypothetical protein